MSISRRFFMVGGAVALAGCAPRYGTLPGGERLVGRPTYAPAPAQPVYVEPDIEPVAQPSAGPTSTSKYVDYFGDEAVGTLVLYHDNRNVLFVQGNGRAISYPVAVGREGIEAPEALYSVFNKRVNPSWTPTQSMRERDPSLPETVAGGTPQNPLGSRAIYLALPDGSDSILRFHGTNAPSSIGTAASSGCFRMYNHDVEDLYDRVANGAKVRVIRGQQNVSRAILSEYKF